MKFLSVLFLICAITLNVSAQDFFVETSGNDANDGSSAKPWLTVFKALGTAKSGAVVHVGAGTFTEPSFLKVPSGVSIIGAGSKQTTILVNKYYDLEKHFVYCDGNREGWAPAVEQFCIQIAKGDNQIIKGFKMNGQKRTCHGAIYMDYGKKVVFDDLDIQDFKFTGLWVYTSDNCEIKNCYLKDNCYGNANNDAGNIMFHANTSLLIHDNVILETGVMNGKGGYGIKTYSKLFVNACFWTSWDANWNAWAVGTKIYNNTITVPELGTWLAGTNGVPDITIEFNGLSAKNCEIFNNNLNNHISLIGIKGTGYDFQSFNVHHNFINLGSRYSYACEVDAQGLLFHHNYVFGGYYPLAQWGNNEIVNNLQIHHNVFDSPRAGQSLVLTDHSTFKDFKFYNNTIIDANGVAQIFKPGSGSFSNVDIRNNLFIAPKLRGDIFSNKTMTGKIDYNGFQNITAKGTNSISGEMKLILSGDKPSTYYQLQSGSPALNAGIEISGITDDFMETAPEMGAFEDGAPVWTVGISQIISAPSVTTGSISNIKAISASCGGNVDNDGGQSVTARGVCWSLNLNPTIDDSKTSDDTGAGAFTSLITGLSAGKTYHVRAYATNSLGTSYGSDATFIPNDFILKIEQVATFESGVKDILDVATNNDNYNPGWYTVVDNPAKDAVNGTNKVLKFERPQGEWKGVRFLFASGLTTEQADSISFDIYLSAKTTHLFWTLKKPMDNGVDDIVKSDGSWLAPEAAKGKWFRVVFPVSSETPVQILNLQIFPNPTNAAWLDPAIDLSADTYYIDNVTIYKQTTATSINQVQIDENRLKIYPNPSNGLINIELKELKSAKISIYNINGKLVYSGKMAKNTEQIDLTAYSGMLLVKIDSKEFVSTKHVVIK